MLALGSVNWPDDIEVHLESFGLSITRGQCVSKLQDLRPQGYYLFNIKGMVTNSPCPLQARAMLIGQGGERSNINLVKEHTSLNNGAVLNTRLFLSYLNRKG